MPECGAQCRQDIAGALCAGVAEAAGWTFGAAAQPAAPLRAELRLAEHSSGMLRSRAHVLWRELECEGADGVPPLKGKRVENGKSASAFLVPGGASVDAEDGGSYSAILKQLNRHEVALLPKLYPQLVRHYARPEGSLLARLIAWVRYRPEAGEPFEAVVMENVANQILEGNQSIIGLMVESHLNWGCQSMRPRGSWRMARSSPITIHMRIGRQEREARVSRR